jgi:hypothetical protein
MAESCDCGYRFPPIETIATSPPATPVSKPNPDLQTAGDWYFWLWFSPILTIPTLFMLNSFAYGEYSEEVVPYIIVLGSAVWHIILLYPAIKGRTAFIRWHGRQALLLAAIRTIVAFVTAISLFAGEYSTTIFGVLLLIGLWLAGNLWGQRQARRGDCALMRWTGHGAGLPIPIEKGSPPVPPAVRSQPDSALVNHLVYIIRFNPDPAVRRAALDELEQLGLVESL